jgi:hypothetical protein
MGWKLMRRVVLFTLLFTVYLVSTVPVGLFLYSMKTAIGIDIFKHGGFHAYMQCKQLISIEGRGGPFARRSRPREART